MLRKFICLFLLFGNLTHCYGQIMINPYFDYGKDPINNPYPSPQYINQNNLTLLQTYNAPGFPGYYTGEYEIYIGDFFWKTE
jgi:hypothetical protein